jgi:predicted nucleic acid-binding protein
MYDSDDVMHRSVISVMDALDDPPIVPMAILAEIDYMLTKHLGMQASLYFLGSIETEVFQLEPSLSPDIVRCRELMTEYSDLKLGVADASIIAIAERLRTPTILSLDQRHFRVVRPNGFSHFILYPADFTS